jgi:hypothetical protein
LVYLVWYLLGLSGTSYLSQLSWSQMAILRLSLDRKRIALSLIAKHNFSLVCSYRSRQRSATTVAVAQPCARLCKTTPRDRCAVTPQRLACRRHCCRRPCGYPPIVNVCGRPMWGGRSAKTAGQYREWRAVPPSTCKTPPHAAPPRSQRPYLAPQRRAGRFSPTRGLFFSLLVGCFRWMSRSRWDCTAQLLWHN